ncbi:MAG TPA: UvrD-helicase domain-containing protein [Baekduia sp.]|uniref:UvrD-helicase domain-containing protein n=1 Tax=Baekduia sp. TaxID=2600305 RepID=UPI002C370107|nr:UvrD-helicase domain-containing protein [Baekduia sp.]HMJ36511.1 UvrD-helicase domain-containing protein [Baekduia sp.]
MSIADRTSDFDVCGPLPQGVTVLEASAGTGKTYTIAALATRYVAEGTPLDQLLLVTFTRLATGELRDRVRQRLTVARQALDAALAAVDPLAGGDALRRHVGADELLRLLAGGTWADVEARRDRLAIALADFDAATITTTHGFCQEVLGGLGVAGDLDRGYRFSEDARDLVEDVVDDLYVRDFLTRGPGFARAQAREIVRAAVDNPTAPIAPPAAPAGDMVEIRHDLAETARAELDRRKRALALMTYDDLVTRLRATLEGEGGAAIAARLRARYRVALVDEFQDTDPDQWAIMRRAFAHEGTTLVLIGDPKQAVYAFRGADVYAYLDAARAADARPTLGINWRSDQDLIDAYDALFGGARLGHEDIAYRPVRAADGNRAPRLSGAPVDTALRIRVVARGTPSVRQTATGFSSVPSAREHVAGDVAADVAALLASGAQLESRGPDGTSLGHVTLGPGDVAVLVRKNDQARAVKAALEMVGVPAVVNGAGSVFATDAARDWLRLLEALERPESLPRARAVALTPFLAWPTEDVAGATDDRWDALQQRLHTWAGVLRRNGVATLMEAITVQQQLPERMLAVLGGERDLTDLRHVGELLHAAAVDGRLGITALAGWLRRRMATDDRDAGAEDRARRLESDAEAVQVLTVHRSKGLEFPVVYCPYLWDPLWISNEPSPAIYHDADHGDVRTVDVSLDARDAAYVQHAAKDKDEQLGEELRLAYVALTRAKHQAVVWWVSSYTSRESALGRLVFGDDAEQQPGSGRRKDAGEVAGAASERFAALARAAPGAIALERSLIAPNARWKAAEPAAADLTAATFDRSLDGRWRRMSYSSITAGAYEARVASEIEAAAGDDDAPAERPVAPPDRADAEDAGAAALRAVPAPLSATPAGTRVGTFVHHVLDAADFTAADLAAELGGHVADAQRRRATDIGDPIVLVDGLRAAIETPLGPLVADRRLRDLGRGDRLDELAFELPLVGGDAPTGELTLAAIAAVLRAHLGAGDPLAGYADRLDDPMLKANLRGYLTGTIDVVARIDPAAGAARFAIIDYKTNRLAAAGEELTAWHHRPAALAEEMQRSHYALQALLYAVALHRYLRWRMPGYDADRDRPAVLYLFLRGMTGVGTPRVDGMPCGVFAWRPPAGLLTALSDVLDGGARA